MSGSIPKRPPGLTPVNDHAGARNARVVALLNQLGDRMIRTEHERIAVREELSAMRSGLKNLEDRAAQSEKIFLTIQDRLSSRDSIEARLLARQDALETLVQENVARMKRAEELTRRIEDAIAQQDRMARRLEKTAQDKAQILSKIERLQISVEQTRQAVDKRAIVSPASANLQDNKAPGFWPESRRGRAALLASLSVAGILFGVAVMQLAQYWPRPDSTPVQVVEAPSATAPTLSPDRFTTTVTDPEELALYGESADSVSPYGENFVDDDAYLAAAMETDPDALASVLNEISPGAIEATAQIEDVAPVAEAITDAAVEAVEAAVQDVRSASTPTETPIPAPVSRAAESQERERVLAENFVRAQVDSARPLGDRIVRDTKLPESILRVEQKAFDGVPEAQHDLAAIYTAGHGGVAVDYKKAAQWFSEAALSGVANARYNLGVLYHQGLGVPRDIARAINWYRAAAVLDHPEAQYNLGIAYIEGIGTQYNPRAAAQNFERAARGGVKEAAYNLGLIHENGLLGTPDMNEAVFWYKTASDHSPEAKVAYEQVVRALSLRSSDIDRIMREYGRIYDGAPTVATGAPAEVVIPPLPAEDSASLLQAVNAERAMIAQIQEQLMRLSLYPGPADGAAGPQTADAIRAYQSRVGMRPNGQPSEDLLVHMLATEINAATGGFDFDFEEYGSRPE